MQLGITTVSKFIEEFLDEVPSEDFNPVQKVPLHVVNSNGRLKILKIRDTPMSTAGTQPQQINRSATEEQAQQQANVEEHNTFSVSTPHAPTDNNVHLMLMMNNLEQQMNEKFDVQNMQIAQLQNIMMQQFETINNNIRRYGGTITSAFANQARKNRGASQVEPQNLFGAFGATDRRATLHPRPRDLLQLWEEWTTGIDGRKAAKDFTSRERSNRVGGLKQKYYRRLLVWKTQARLIDGGMSLIAANNRITTITGATTITGVINRLIAFKKTYQAEGGVHPQLKNG